MSRPRNLVITGALLLGLAACGSSSEQAGFAGAPAPAHAPNANSGSGSGSGKTNTGAQQQQAQPQPQQPAAPVQERKLVQTARIEMTVKDPVEAIFRARSIATDNNGFTGQEDSRGDKATLTLRVPVDRFDRALEALAKLGTITQQTKQADDVTEQVVDLDSRLATQRESVNRIQALLAKAQNITEVAQIESELTRRQSDLESLQSRREALGGKAALSTVTVQVTKEASPPAAAAKAETGGFVDGLSDGWGAFGKFFTVVTAVLGTILPFLVVFGVPAGIVLYLRRRRRKPAEPAEVV